MQCQITTKVISRLCAVETEERKEQQQQANTLGRLVGPVTARENIQLRGQRAEERSSV